MRRVVMLVLAVCMTLAGCQPAPGGVTPEPGTPASPSVDATGVTASASPVASYQCTPASGTPTPCSDDQNKLYAEAERVLRAYVAEDERTARTGEIASPEVLAMLGDDMARSFLERTTAARAAGVSAVGTAYKIPWIRPKETSSTEREIKLEYCLDASSITITTPSVGSRRGNVVRATATFTQVASRMLLTEQVGTVGGTCS